MGLPHPASNALGKHNVLKSAYTKHQIFHGLPRHVCSLAYNEQLNANVKRRARTILLPQFAYIQKNRDRRVTNLAEAMLFHWKLSSLSVEITAVFNREHFMRVLSTTCS